MGLMDIIQELMDPNKGKTPPGATPPYLPTSAGAQTPGPAPATAVPNPVTPMIPGAQKPQANVPYDMGPPKSLAGDLGMGPNQLPGPSRAQGSELLEPILPNQISVPQREKAESWIDMPWYKDKDRMGMMLAALSNGFGNMTLRGNQGMRGVNNMLIQKGMQGMEENKTMKYLAENNPELFKVMAKVPPGQRGDYMKLAMQSRFATQDESAFAEKVRMLEESGVPRDQALAQVLSGSGTNITMNMGGGAKPFEAKLGEAAADWVSGRNIASRGNRREANRVIEDLERAIESGQPVTGSFASYFPDSVRNMIDAEGLDMQQSVERIVQQSLKETLGAQFAQKEAEQLFARTWNPKASPQVNLRRTKRLLAELDAYAANMDRIANGMLQSDGNILQYLKENPLDSGSLFGTSIYDIEYEEPYDAGTPVQKPADVLQADWDLLTDEQKELFREGAL